MDRHDLCRAAARDAGRIAHRAFGTSATSMIGRDDAPSVAFDQDAVIVLRC